ncbi:uncharacterized protein LOC106663310 [Cimex lectularius]|uniref:SAGA-associated factor 11 n=1 Tax=Cimex lectularius TaxID=79782 RepID=A0A8I6RGN2_CIMLE|nr:uncharacterized protein LOC106663310 [Cimex lectularius]XP_014243531.1 uncharacterized protein LOC106663310 [Cimex lectularius]
MEAVFSDAQENAKVIMNTCLTAMKAQVYDNKACVNSSSELITNKLIDEIVLEVIADYHKTIIKWCDDDGIFNKKNSKIDEESLTNGDSQPVHIGVKVKKIICPKCRKQLYPTGFGRHLEICLNVSSSNRTLRNATKPIYSSVPSYDDNYDTWNSKSEKSKNLKRIEQKKKKDISKRIKRREGHIKTKHDICSIDSGIELEEVDSQGSKNDTGNSCAPSPAESVSTSKGSSSKKKIKQKQKYGSKGSKNKFDNYSIDLGSSSS